MLWWLFLCDKWLNELLGPLGPRGEDRTGRVRVALLQSLRRLGYRSASGWMETQIARLPTGSYLRELARRGMEPHEVLLGSPPRMFKFFFVDIEKEFLQWSSQHSFGACPANRSDRD